MVPFKVHRIYWCWESDSGVVVWYTVYVIGVSISHLLSDVYGGHNRSVLSIDAFSRINQNWRGIDFGLVLARVGRKNLIDLCGDGRGCGIRPEWVVWPWSSFIAVFDWKSSERTNFELYWNFSSLKVPIFWKILNRKQNTLNNFFKWRHQFSGEGKCDFQYFSVTFF